MSWFQIVVIINKRNFIMKNAFLFLNQQKMFVVLLIVLIVMPFLLLSLYGPDIPYTPYFFLICLFVLKTIIFDETTLEKRLTPKVAIELQKEKKKPASKADIFKRVLFHIRARDITLLTTFFLVLSIGIVFNRF